MARKKRIVEYRECARCGWQTQRSTFFIPKCEECGASLVAKQKQVEVTERRRRRKRSGNDQDGLFDKHDYD